MRLTYYVLSSTLLCAACSGSISNYTPILDGPPSAAFDADITACRTLSLEQRQFDAETAGAAVIGAGIGATLGAVDQDTGALGGAIAGMLAGGVASAVDVDERRKGIVRECLRGRGHPVVG